MRKIILLALATFAIAAVPASAARGSISLDQSDPSWGDTITFTLEIPDRAVNPALQVSCYQSGVLVYASGGFPIPESFHLTSQSWTGGAADCVAELQDFGNDGTKRKPLARPLEFAVSA